MKRSEIEAIAVTDLSTNGWLRLIALILAEPDQPCAMGEAQPRRRPGRPKKVA